MFKLCVTLGHAIYKIVFSPFIGQSCRYLPSCSDYTASALKRHGLIKGIKLGLKRIWSCRPGGGFGYDPVPEIKEKPACQKQTDPHAPLASHKTGFKIKQD